MPCPGAAALGLVSLAVTPVWTQPVAWPAKPITLDVGSPPGGQTDFAAWVQRGVLQSTLGRAVVIDNSWTRRSTPRR